MTTIMSDDLRALLDAWKAESRVNEGCVCHTDTLIAAVEAVLEVHRPGDGASQGFTSTGYGWVEPYCSGCEASDEYAVEWPCYIVTALHAALTGDDDE